MFEHHKKLFRKEAERNIPDDFDVTQRLYSVNIDMQKTLNAFNNFSWKDVC